MCKIWTEISHPLNTAGPGTYQTVLQLTLLPQEADALDLIRRRGRIVDVHCKTWVYAASGLTEYGH